MTRAAQIRDAARTASIAYAAEHKRRDASPAYLERLKGRVEGLLIGAHIAEGTSYSKDGIVAEGSAYTHAAIVRPDLTHEEIMRAYRSGLYD